MSHDEIYILLTAIAVVVILILRSGSWRNTIQRLSKQCANAASSNKHKLVSCKQSYVIPKTVIDHVKTHCDQEALAGIIAACGLDEEKAKAVLDELKKVHLDSIGITGSATLSTHSKKHSYKISSEVLDLLRQGQQDEAVKRFCTDSGLQQDAARAILTKAVESLKDI